MTKTGTKGYLINYNPKEFRSALSELSEEDIRSRLTEFYKDAFQQIDVNNDKAAVMSDIELANSAAENARITLLNRLCIVLLTDQKKIKFCGVCECGERVILTLDGMDNLWYCSDKECKNHEGITSSGPPDWVSFPR